MVYVRKRRTTKRTTKRRVYKRKFNTKRSQYGRGGFLNMVRWSSKDATGNCHVTYSGVDLVPDNIAATTFAYSDVTGYGEMQSLFDNYRINKILYRWVLNRTPDWSTTNGNRGWSVRVFWRHDFNDSTPIAQNLLFQGGNLREVYLNTDRLQTKWYTLRPSTLSTMYEGATATAYSPKWRQWMDTNDFTTHYGIKLGYNNLYAGLQLRLECKYVMEFKGIS